MKKIKPFLFVLIAGAILALFTGCEEPNPVYTVKYEITGPETIASKVAYINSDGIIVNLQNVSIPWQTTISVKGFFRAVCEIAFQSPVERSAYYINIYKNENQLISRSVSNFLSAFVEIKN